MRDEREREKVSFFACEIFEKKKNFDRKDTLKSVFFWVHAPSRCKKWFRRRSLGV